MTVGLPIQNIKKGLKLKGVQRRFNKIFTLMSRFF